MATRQPIARRTAASFALTLIATVATMAALGLAGCQSSDDKPTKAQAPVVKVAKVTKAEWTQPPLTGTVVARTESQLGFQAGGRIAERLVERGQQVVKGQVLYRLDEQDLKLRLKASEAAVSQAKANAQFAQENFRRMKSLLARKVVGQQDYDQALSQRNVANAALLAARSERDQAKRSLDYAVLKAPFDGTVLTVERDSGDVVSIGQPVVVLAQAGQIEALVDVASDRLDSLPKLATAATSSGAVWLASIRSVGGTADPVTRTWPVRYLLTLPKNTAATGRSARLGETVQLTFADAQPHLSVPISSLSATDQTAHVLVIRQGHVHQHPVKVLRLDNERAEVDTDLPVGTAIVGLGVNRLHDGEAVRVEAGSEVHQ